LGDGVHETNRPQTAASNSILALNVQEVITLQTHRDAGHYWRRQC